MCDLIDLSSPDVKGLNAAKLASPLIPVPRTIDVNAGGANSLAPEKHDSLDSNPFDRVLNETTEYISKKGDPFEMMLQRALKFKGRKTKELRAQSVDFTDDFTPKRKKRYLKTMNKTLDALDESLLGDKPDLSCKKLAMEIKEGNVISHDTRNADVTRNNSLVENASVPENNLKIVITNSDSLESSILNQSAMNDTLLDPISKEKEDNKISPFLKNDTLFEELILPPCSNVKSRDPRRTLSQGDRVSPTKLPCPKRRLQSAMDDQRKALQSESSFSSLDRGFLDSKQSEQSVFSSLSNISSVTKPNSASVSSLMLSTDTMNDAFLNSGSFKVNQEKINKAEGSLEVKPKQYDLSDITERFNKLKCAINSISSTDSNSLKEDNNKQVTKDKLIDVDVFILEQNSSRECSKNSISTSSSDSVFTDTNKFDKSILNEAKALARTFEELALKTDSGSNTDDDLISTNILWMSELLPAFEDEPVVDNLIELPVSPEGNTKDDKKSDTTSTDKENSLKEIASQFSDSVPIAKQTVVISLLSDLKKLIRAENNTKVNELFDGLEIALGANCKTNTELLITCLNISNELQSPPKSNTAESSEKASTDKSKDESEKMLFEREIYNNEKSSDISQKLENTSQTATTAAAAIPATDDDASSENSLCNDNSESPNDTSTSKVASNTSSEEQDNQLDEKLAIELLMNLGKLLRGQSEDATTMQLLKNIGKALNIASNMKFESEQQTDCDRKPKIQQTTPVKATGPNRVACLTNAKNRRSIEFKSRTIEKTGRRSVSVIDSSTRNMPSTQRRYKSISDVDNRKKRFSNDSKFFNVANKVAIPEASKKKAETVEHDVKKENPIAIGDVKNKLKKRTNVLNKKGPMKAVHPVNNIQKRASIGKQAAPAFDTVTPPKSDKATSSGNKLISSTPNSLDNNHCMPKKPAKSKPIASSTPDGQNGKTLGAQTSVNKNRNFSCDISPVATYANTNDNDERKDSPKRSSKLPTPKKCTTPKRQETDRIPRYSTPSRHNSSFSANHQHTLPESPQRLNRSLACQRYSPVHQRKRNEKLQQSPLKENRVIAKVKPLKLISKLKRHSNVDFTEKENNCT